VEQDVERVGADTDVIRDGAAALGEYVAELVIDYRGREACED
jgi:hypothetical protein